MTNGNTGAGVISLLGVAIALPFFIKSIEQVQKIGEDMENGKTIKINNGKGGEHKCLC